MDLLGKVAVVTGSTKGIGEGIAKEMAREGAHVVVTGRDVEGGNRVVKEIEAEGGSAVFHAADLGDEAACKGLLDFAVQTFGGLHVLVNNHAPTVEIMEKQYDTYLADTTSEHWDFLVRYGQTSIYYMLKNVLPIMVAGGGGSIVNISSLTSVSGVPGMGMYSATKGAMNALTRNVAVDYGDQGIRCNTIVVGIIMSNPRMDVAWSHPGLREASLRNILVGRFGKPADIAHAAVYFASDKSSYVTGQELKVDGGICTRMPVPHLQDGFAVMADELG